MRRPALLLSVACACAPAQHELLAQRHYIEALAGVEEGALDGGVVLATIAADLQVGVHLQAVPADRVRAEFPAAPAGLDQIAVVRAIHDAHDLPLTELGVSFALLRGGVPVEPIDASLPGLAARLGEPVLEARVVHHPAGTRYGAVVRTRFPLLEIFGRVMFNVATVGVLHSAVPIVEGKDYPASTSVVEPTELDYARASPNATAVHRWAAEPSCRGAARCERHLLWPRVDGPLELAVVVRVDYTDPPMVLYRIPLPPGPLDAALDATFGGRVRSLEELARAAGVRPQVSHIVDLHLDHVSLEFDGRSRRRLCRQLRRGLLGRPDLHFVFEVKDPDAEDVQRALAVREALVGCGVRPEQIELDERGPADFELRARYIVDPVPAPP